jgi:hypothetical protein
MNPQLELLNWLRDVITERIEQLRNGHGPKIDPVRQGFESAASSDDGVQVFSFKVSDDGTFTFEPPGEWEYNGKQLIRIESESGEFTLSPSRVEGWLGTRYGDPWGGPQLARPDRRKNVWFVQTKQRPYDAPNNVPEALREALYRQQGYISKVNYTIEARSRSGEVYVDDTRNGVYSC